MEEGEAPAEPWRRRLGRSLALPLVFNLPLDFKKILQSVVDRLRQVAKQPGGAEGEQTGLPKWFAAMVNRLSPAMHAEGSIKELLAQGLALAHTWLETQRVVMPVGMDHEAFDRESRAVIDLVPDPIPFEVGLHHNELLVFPATERPLTSLVPIGRLRAGHGRFQIDASGQQAISVLCDKDTKTTLALNKLPARVRIETPYDRLHLASMERPGWASRLWSDQFGMAAEFVIRDVLFVLRWIPPGTFWMGSPESELGRADWERPQHEVTISEGFWMGETPVTQSQWAAIVEVGMAKKLITKDSGLKPKPSGFSSERIEDQGKPPVEQVSWNQRTAICQVLDQLMENGPGFRLPTEAQWEHACRAGTQSAFNDGSDCTLPDGLDPALLQLGWFDKISYARTQYVKQKRSNRWGLYDMHGNVWERCADAWVENVYVRRKEGVIDPVEDSNSDSASRVVRGGSWSYRARSCLAAFRGHWSSGLVWTHNGLRLSAGQGVVRAEPNGAERTSKPKRRSRGGGT